MTLLNPWLLVLLIPWTALTIYLFRGARTSQSVPFLHLWRGPIKPKPTAPSTRLPDLPILLALFAILFAIFASAKPATVRESPSPLAVSQLRNEPHVAYLAARETPRPQVMIRIVQDRPESRDVPVTINGLTNSLHLSKSNEDFFIDVEKLDDTITVHLDNDSATIKRQSSYPQLIAGIDDRHLQKFLNVYQHDRPTSSNTKRIVIGSDVLLPPCNLLPSNQQLDVQSHPLTAHLDWPRIIASAKVTSNSPPPDWKPLVFLGDQPLLAISPTSPRKVWLGFSTDQLATSADYVILWTNIVNYLGEVHENFTTWSRPLEAPVASPAPQQLNVRILSSILLSVSVALITLAFLTFSAPRLTFVSAAEIG